MRSRKLPVMAFASVLLASPPGLAAAEWIAAAGPITLDLLALDRVVAAGASSDLRDAGEATKATKPPRASKKGQKNGKKHHKGKKRSGVPLVDPTMGSPLVVEGGPTDGVVEPVLVPPPALAVTPPNPDPTHQGSSAVHASGTVSYRSTETTKKYGQTLFVTGSASR